MDLASTVSGVDSGTAMFDYDFDSTKRSRFTQRSNMDLALKRSI